MMNFQTETKKIINEKGWLTDEKEREKGRERGKYREKENWYNFTREETENMKSNWVKLWHFQARRANELEILSLFWMQIDERIFDCFHLNCVTLVTYIYS